MASTLKKGSRGDEVKTLQSLLNKSGNYGLSEDGIYGSKTADAVRQYQQSNGLTVDGIVGENTWTKLNGGAATETPTSSTTQSTYTPDATTSSGNYELAQQYINQYNEKGDYTPSDRVAGLQEALDKILGNQPSDFTGSTGYEEYSQKARDLEDLPEYTSRYDPTIQDLYRQIMNRGEFDYDFNADPLYQQYKDSYTRQGHDAMVDTTATAAALSGGYGNSYATAAGNQAYQQYLTQLNDVIPELEELALNRYRNEDTRLRNNLSMVQGLEDTDYSRYRDDVSDAEALRDYYRDVAETEYSRDYGEYRDKVGDWEDQASLYSGLYGDEYSRDYGEYTDAMSRLMSMYDASLSNANTLASLEQAAAAAASSSGSGGSGGGSGNGSGGTSGEDLYTVQGLSAPISKTVLNTYLDAGLVKKKKSGKYVYTGNSAPDVSGWGETYVKGLGKLDNSLIRQYLKTKKITWNGKEYVLNQ